MQGGGVGQGVVEEVDSGSHAGVRVAAVGSSMSSECPGGFWEL